MSILTIPDNPASVNKIIPKEKLFDAEIVETFAVSEVKWLMSIKPGIRNVAASVSGRRRFEEIEVISIIIGAFPDKDNLPRLLRQLHAKIMYPCVVFLEHRDRYKIVSWNIIDSVKKTNGVVLLSSYISAWIREPATSSKTKRCRDGVLNLLLSGEGSIRKMYDKICGYILDCSPQYLGSRAHLSRLVYDLTGVKNHSVINRIESRRKYVVNNPYDKYSKKDYGSQYKYSYDYEDIWYEFMEDESIKRVIENRRYRDMEDLVLQIDTKYEEHPDRW